MLVVFLEKQEENGVIRLLLKSLFSGKIAFIRLILSPVSMEFSPRIASTVYWSHLQSGAKEKRSRPRMKNKTKPPLRNGLQ